MPNNTIQYKICVSYSSVAEDVSPMGYQVV